MYKVRTYNHISIKGLERFPRQSYEVGSDIGQPDAFLLRSQKLHDLEVPKSLLAAARSRRMDRRYTVIALRRREPA